MLIYESIRVYVCHLFCIFYVYVHNKNWAISTFSPVSFFLSAGMRAYVRACVHACVHVCVCARERESVRVRELHVCECVHVHVCVCEREREREGEGENCMCVYVFICTFVHVLSRLQLKLSDIHLYKMFP